MENLNARFLPHFAIRQWKIMDSFSAIICSATASAVCGGFCLCHFSHTHLGTSVTCTQHSRTASLTVGFAPLNTHRHFSDLSIFVWILKRYFQCILNCLHSSHLNLASHSSSELIWAAQPVYVVMTAAVQWSPEIPRGCPHIMNIKLAK